MNKIVKRVMTMFGAGAMALSLLALVTEVSAATKHQVVEIHEALKIYIDIDYAGLKDYTKIRELPFGKGYADIVFLPKRFSDKPAMVVEFHCGGLR